MFFTNPGRGSCPRRGETWERNRPQAGPSCAERLPPDCFRRGISFLCVRTEHGKPGEIQKRTKNRRTLRIWIGGFRCGHPDVPRKTASPLQGRRRTEPAEKRKKRGEAGNPCGVQASFSCLQKDPDHASACPVANIAAGRKGDPWHSRGFGGASATTLRPMPFTGVPSGGERARRAETIFPDVD